MQGCLSHGGVIGPHTYVSRGCRPATGGAGNYSEWEEIQRSESANHIESILSHALLLIALFQEETRRGSQLRYLSSRQDVYVIL